ncbi:MAG: ribosome biogenesis GTPase Der, partial [Campylobacteraceae bacterium]|nr:ribosome biogenesis GTPase Der [Campylobacteraceae bacterium]
KKSIKDVRDRFKFLFYAPIITVSALSKKRVPKILDLIMSVYENYSRRIPTSKLNKLLKEAVLKHPIPSDKGKLVKIYFATQFDICPPRIALVMNRPHVLHFSYKRYIMNQLRENVELDGAPLVLIPRKRSELDPEDKED